MAINPDTKDYIGYGNEQGMTPGGAYLVPSTGMLRFVERPVEFNHGEGDVVTVKNQRILQRYEWSHSLGNHDWFDVALVDAD